MSLAASPGSRSLYTRGDETSFDGEVVTFSGADYVPSGGSFRGLSFTGTGVLKIKTLAGQDLTIGSSLTAGVIHPIGGTKVYSGTTTVSGLIVWA
jgi:hypothetical protein